MNTLGYQLGRLEYRSLRFETKILNVDNFQGNAVVNYTGHEVDYTRVIEHKHFEYVKDNNKTVVTYEYPDDWDPSKEAYYTVINDDKNNELADEYRLLIRVRKKMLYLVVD
jgi:UDP-galactopyranose mutase